LDGLKPRLEKGIVLSKTEEKMRNIMLVVPVLALLGCVSSETQVREAIRKNPKIVFDVIEEHPEQFIEVVNRAAQAAQQKQYEKQAGDLKRQQEEDLKNPKTPMLDAHRRLLGADSGKIVLVEYADFECPACGMAYEGLKKFKAKHKDQIQFYYKNMPLSFHKMAYPAASYFEAVFLQDKEKAAKFYEYVFENQRSLSEEFLKKAVKGVGANLAKVDKDLESSKVKAVIAEDMEEFRKFGFTGTPVVLINGVALNGAQSFEELERVWSMVGGKPSK
jgi:protein-disulfide isomerase